MVRIRHISCDLNTDYSSVSAVLGIPVLLVLLWPLPNFAACPLLIFSIGTTSQLMQYIVSLPLPFKHQVVLQQPQRALRSH
jgi:hypothetical protein